MGLAERLAIVDDSDGSTGGGLFLGRAGRSGCAFTEDSVGPARLTGGSNPVTDCLTSTVDRWLKPSY